MKYLLIPLVLLFGLGIGFIVAGINLESEVIIRTIYETEYIDRVVEKTIEVEVEVTKEVTIEVEVLKEVPRKLRYFDSLEELEAWLAQDRTDILVISPPDYDCEDYAMALVESAFKDGYFMSTQLWGAVKRERDKLGGTHMYNMTFIGNKMYLIEPQDDKIVAVGSLD